MFTGNDLLRAILRGNGRLWVDGVTKVTTPVFYLNADYGICQREKLHSAKLLIYPLNKINPKRIIPLITAGVFYISVLK